jgi:hypothetical protein
MGGAASPRVASGELEALKGYLDAQRQHVLGILDGLPEEQLRRPVLPTGWSCLGLVRHWRVPEVMSAEDVFAEYRAAIERSDSVLAAAGERTRAPEREPAAWPERIWPDWRLPDLRHILLHVITETACHAGHLDAVRELTDGTTWLGGDPHAE